MTLATQPSPPNGLTRVRAGQSADVEPLARLVNSAFVVERIAFDGDRIAAQGVREYMQKGVFLLAEDATGLAGCVHIEIRSDRSYLGLLSVAPANQGTGLGRLLVAAAEEYARNAGCHTMDLRIISPRAHSLLPFYQQLGYSQTGTAPLPSDAAPKVPCHFVLMTKNLR